MLGWKVTSTKSVAAPKQPLGSGAFNLGFLLHAFALEEGLGAEEEEDEDEEEDKIEGH